MSFILVNEIEVLWPVLVTIPADHGALREMAIEIKFVIGSTDDMDNHLTALQNLLFESSSDNRQSDIRELWATKIRGFDQIFLDAEKKKPLKYSKKNLERLLSSPFVMAALPEAYAKANAGIVEKNLVELLDISSAAPQENSESK
jgi:hypothetical protein